jgi:hypothetical protein
MKHESPLIQTMDVTKTNCSNCAPMDAGRSSGSSGLRRLNSWPRLKRQHCPTGMTEHQKEVRMSVREPVFDQNTARHAYFRTMHVRQNSRNRHHFYEKP